MYIHNFLYISNKVRIDVFFMSSFALRHLNQFSRRSQRQEETEDGEEDEEEEADDVKAGVEAKCEAR